MKKKVSIDGKIEEERRASLDNLQISDNQLNLSSNGSIVISRRRCDSSTDSKIQKKKKFQKMKTTHKSISLSFQKGKKKNL